MNRIILLIVYLIFILDGQCISQNIKHYYKKAFVEIPSGSYLGSNLKSYYMSQTEVSNKEYREFIEYLISNKINDYLIIADVKGSLWGNYCQGKCNLMETYFFHPAFDDYPVVNVSKEGAKLYCDWFFKKSNKLGGKIVECRLPTENEWMYGASCGNETSIYGNCLNDLIESSGIKDNKLSYVSNGWFYEYPYSIDNSIDSLDGCFFTCNVKKYSENNFNLYNMSGNVAEMIDDKPIVKGGSWIDPINLHKISSSCDYVEPKPYIGFRIVLILKDD